MARTNNYELINHQIKNNEEMSQDVNQVENLLESFRTNPEMGAFSHKETQLLEVTSVELGKIAQDQLDQDQSMTPSSERPELSEFAREETHLIDVATVKKPLLERSSARRVIKAMASRYRLIAASVLAYRILIEFVSADLPTLISEFAFDAALSPF